MIDIPNLIDPGNPRRFCGEILLQLSKRDSDDLTRLTGRVGELGMIRYFAARQMDPLFVSGVTERAFKRFGHAIELAYQDLVAEIAVVEARRAHSDPCSEGT